MKKITLNEYLGPKGIVTIPPQHVQNALDLLEIVNKVLEDFGEYRKCNSGYRHKDDQIRIYKEKAAREGKPFDISKVPMSSRHLDGCAIDLADPTGDLKEWIEDKLASYGLYMEAKEAAPTWAHLQSRSPKSGRRIFMP